MTYSLTGMSSLGTISSEESTKEANLFNMQMPGSNSSAAILFDLFGASRVITIKGVYTVGDGTISTFVQALDALIDGTQTASTFASDKSGTSYSVFVNRVSWSSDEGEVNKVSYTIEMIEGA